ncbi:hypothetical protein [Candidatus Ichthyocystis sparus]|uniref:hypothetical protein n=1 Tax=Candidatus Ichthyocystis sparus TaxID=1561004 RepID=UPI000B89C4F5|nr:hypothetical protein [Candidatus Ichthyocystis sparus]
MKPINNLSRQGINHSSPTETPSSPIKQSSDKGANSMLDLPPPRRTRPRVTEGIPRKLHQIIEKGQEKSMLYSSNAIIEEEEEEEEEQITPYENKLIPKRRPGLTTRSASIAPELDTIWEEGNQSDNTTDGKTHD